MKEVKERSFIIAETLRKTIPAERVACSRVVLHILYIWRNRCPRDRRYACSFRADCNACPLCKHFAVPVNRSLTIVTMKMSVFTFMTITIKSRFLVTK